MRSVIEKIFKVCPRSGRIVGIRQNRYAAMVALPLLGIAALMWFAIRVIPKPSRAAYPCQKIAAPLAAGFFVWLAGIAGGFVFFKKAKEFFHQRRYLLAALSAITFIVFGLWSYRNEIFAAAVPSTPPNTPYGIARGINPGRVVWVCDPAAAKWSGSTTDGTHWYDPNLTDQARVNAMLSNGLCLLTTNNDNAAAWGALFVSFNRQCGRGSNVSYAAYAGKKIVIKINQNAANSSTNDNYALNGCNNRNCIVGNPHLVYALLWQLVNRAGVAESNITVYDASGTNRGWGGPRTIGDYMYLYITSNTNGLQSFPGVHFMDGVGKQGREPAAWPAGDNVSYPGTGGTASKGLRIAQQVLDAAYLINMPVMKSHGDGPTLCAKNHYGTVSGQRHGNLWKSGASESVVLMGHKDLGEKTLLFIIDSLYGASGPNNVPTKWKMAPYSNRWPASMFLSQDGVAIESVGWDFLNAEWGMPQDTDYYLWEAASIPDASGKKRSGTIYTPNLGSSVFVGSLGVFEHWNSNTMKYSGNLFPDSRNGIELLCVMTNADLAAPSVPSGLIANAATESNVALRWQPSADNIAVSGYVVYRNGNYRTNVSSTNFTDSGLASNTTYAYQVSAYDALPNISARSAAVNVKTDCTPPSVAITSPANNAKYAARAYPTVTAAASDIGSAVVKVEFYTNGGKVGEDTNASGGWTCLMPGLTAGTYAITAKAFDTVGNNAVSAAVAITVTNPAATNVYQAESYAAKNSGTIFGSGYKGYTGSGYIDYGSINSYLEWTNIIVTNSGTFRLTFRYAIGNNTGNRPCVARVGNSNIGSMTFIYTGSWSNWQTVYIDVPLINGTNRVRLTATSNTGGPNLDSMTVTTPGGALPMAMTENTNASLPIQPAVLAVTPEDRGGPAVCELLTLKDVKLVFDRVSKNMKITYTAAKDYDDTDELTLELSAAGISRMVTALSGPESMILTARDAQVTLSNEPSSCLMRVLSQDGDRATEYIVAVPETPQQKNTGVTAANNPYRGDGVITINNIPAGSSVSIYSLSGKHIADLGAVVTGGGSVIWNVKDMNGRPVSPGVYICRTKSGGIVSTIRIMITAGAERH